VFVAIKRKSLSLTMKYFVFFPDPDNTLGSLIVFFPSPDNTLSPFSLTVLTALFGSGRTKMGAFLLVLTPVFVPHPLNIARENGRKSLYISSIIFDCFLD
jgi:hypothetical protein